MKLHELSPAAGSTAPAWRKGRGPGSGNGKTAGKGHKGQNARSGLQQDFVCQCQAGALVAVPEKLSARTPAEGVQRLFCRRGISGKNRGQFRPDFCFLRHRRRIVRAGDCHASGAQLAPLQRFVAGDERIELAEIFQRDWLVNRAH